MTKVDRLLVKMKTAKAAVIMNGLSKQASPERGTTKCCKRPKMLKKRKSERLEF
jgi:hypothetical protein